MSSDPRQTSPWSHRLLGAGLLAAAVGAGAALPPTTPPATQGSSTAATQDSAVLRQRYAMLLQKKFLLDREKKLKELQLALAGDDAPYLLFDLADAEIRIIIRTTAVHTIPLERVEIEGERRLFSAVDPPPDWANRTYHLTGKSGPPRQAERIVPGTGAAKTRDDNPRAVTPEMLGLPAGEDLPERYTLLFDDGMAVTLDGVETGETSWLERGITKITDVLTPPELPTGDRANSVRVWVRLRLARELSRSLYPSLFTGMRAMFRMPGDPRL